MQGPRMETPERPAHATKVWGYAVGAACLTGTCPLPSQALLRGLALREGKALPSGVPI